MIKNFITISWRLTTEGSFGDGKKLDDYFKDAKVWGVKDRPEGRENKDEI